MELLSRITQNPEIMGEKPCIQGLSVTVGTVVGLRGRSMDEILKDHPYLEGDIFRRPIE